MNVFNFFSIVKTTNLY